MVKTFTVLINCKYIIFMKADFYVLIFYYFQFCNFTQQNFNNNYLFSFFFSLRFYFTTNSDSDEDQELVLVFM